MLGGGLFGGQNKPATAPAIGGGLFGAATTAPATGGLFGAPAATTGTTTGGLFGGGGGAPAPAAGGLFGGGAPAAAAGTTGGLFGGQPTTAPAAGGLFGAPQPQQQQQQGLMGGAATGGLFGQPTQQQGGLFGGLVQAPQQQQMQQQNPTYYNGQMQTLQATNQMGYAISDQRHDFEVEQMLRQHNQIMNFQKEFSTIVLKIQETVKDANKNLVVEAQKLQQGKTVLTAAKQTATSIAGNTQTAQLVEKKGINKERIEETSGSLQKIRAKNEIIFAKLLEVHCLIERVASNANTIDRDSNAEMRVFRNFNDIDAKIHAQNQKLIDLNHKLIDSKNMQENNQIARLGGAPGQNSTASSARDHNGTMNSAALLKKKQVLIEMLAQMKKGIEIVKEQHQEDSKDFEILVKKLNASRMHPF